MYAAVENTGESVPAFLVKLWTLVEDPSTDNLIQWDPSGTSFHVYDQQSFSREILPLYFKHNNIASFIRQLNMYGFRKVAHIEQGGLKVEKDDLQFQHQYFQRGERELLQYIKRKVSARVTDNLAAAKPDEYSRVLTDVKQVKVKQESMDQNLEYIKRENKLLWREVATLRQKHHKQQQIVNKLIQFLVSLVSSNRTGLTIPPIRRMPLAINDVSQVAASPPPPATATTATTLGLQQQQQASMVDNITQLTGSTNLPSQINLQSSQNVDQGYTIESPKMDNFLLTSTESNSGPIIHELTEPLVSLLPVTKDDGDVGNFIVQSEVQPIVSELSQQVSATRSNMILNPKQLVLLPATSATKLDFSSGQQQMGTIVSPTEALGTSHALMSPKIELAPSLEDALTYGLIVPSSSSSTASTVSTSAAMSPPQNSAQAKQRKRRSQQPAPAEGDHSPTKKVQSPFVNMSGKGSNPALRAQLQTQLPQGHMAANSQSSPGNNILKALVGQVDQSSHSMDANLAVTASKDNDEFTLSSDQLDLLSSDMDGLKAILQDQYKVDPSFLMEDLDELKVDSEKDDAGTSTSDERNILGNELVEYNPREELFPELMADNIMADIDDID